MTTDPIKSAAAAIAASVSPSLPSTRSRYMKNGRDEALRDVLEEVLRFDPDGGPAVPIQIGRQLETRGLVVTGPSGEGKTTLLERNLDDTPGLGLFDGRTGHVVKLTVPPEASLKGVALSLLDEIGYGEINKISAAETWSIALHRLALLKISVLWIDEAHHFLTPGPGKDPQVASRRLKLLLQGDHALVVILSGVPILTDLLRKDEETWRRFVKLCNAKDRVLVAVERNGAAVFEQVAFQDLEITERALGGHVPQFHQRAGRIVDEDEQGAWIGAILEPAMIRPVNLDQLTKTFTA